MNRIIPLFIILIFFLSCKKSDKKIYELIPDKEFYYIKKENGDSIKVYAERFKLDYSKPKFLTISRFNHSIKKFNIESILLNVDSNYYNYFNLSKKDSLDENSYVFLTKRERKIENDIEPTPISYWKKGTEIFKKEYDGVYSRQLFFTSPQNYILDFGKYYYYEDYKIFKIVETIGKDTIIL